MSTHLTNALGVALAHFLWEGAGLAAMVLLFRRADARVRYASACAVLFAMPLAFAWTLWGALYVPDGAPVSGLAARIIALAPVETGNGSPAAPSAPLSAWLVSIWMAGVAGPYRKWEEPTPHSLGKTFSCFEAWDSRTPEGHVKRLSELIRVDRQGEDK